MVKERVSVLKFNSQAFPPTGDVMFESPSYLEPDGTRKKGYDPSQVDSSSYEQLKDVVERYINTGDLRGVRMTIDYYDIDSDAPGEQVVSDISPHRLRGFDIVDGHNFVKETFSNLRKDVKNGKKVVQGDPAKAGSDGPKEPSAKVVQGDPAKAGSDGPKGPSAVVPQDLK